MEGVAELIAQFEADRNAMNVAWITYDMTWGNTPIEQMPAEYQAFRTNLQKMMATTDKMLRKLKRLLAESQSSQADQADEAVDA